jgi:uncharacterized protein (DUF2384 family)
MTDDDIQDINSISLDIKNFCDMLMSLNKKDEVSRLVLEIRDCANTIVQIVKESRDDRKQLNVGEELISRLKNLNSNIDLKNDIRIRLKQLIKPEFIESWLNTPNLAFGYKRPIDLINENDLDKLHNMLYVLESGEPLS